MLLFQIMVSVLTGFSLLCAYKWIKSGAMWVVPLVLNVFVLWLLIDSYHNHTQAQEPVDPDWGIELKWAANPVDENVDNYIVSWFDGSRQAWVKLADVVPDNPTDDLVYTTRIAWIKSTLVTGNDLCFNIVAQHTPSNTLSDASESACVVIVDPAPPIVGISPDPVEVSAPAKPTVRLLEITP